MEFVIAVLEDAKRSIERLILDIKEGGVKKTVWDIRVSEINKAVKFLSRNSQNGEAGEQRPTKQSLPCRWCGYPLNAKLQCVNGSCDHCGE